VASGVARRVKRPASSFGRCNEQWIFAAGPSLAVDTACATGLYVIDHAVRSIRSGQCDAAIVGAANVILHPLSSLNFRNVGVLSQDGASKSFDASGLRHCHYSFTNTGFMIIG